VATESEERVAQSVEDICKTLVKDSKLVANCNDFLFAVAQKVASEYAQPDIVSAFTGKADTIRARFRSQTSTSKPFVYIGTDPDLATKYATEGQFVVGGLTSTEMTYTGRDGKLRKATMGHVVVVVPGGPSEQRHVKLANGVDQPARGGYPYCYQGAANSMYRFSERTSVDVVFPNLLLDKVIYAYIAIKAK
jgi:hypothetical protein